MFVAERRRRRMTGASDVTHPHCHLQSQDKQCVSSAEQEPSRGDCGPAMPTVRRRVGAGRSTTTSGSSNSSAQQQQKAKMTLTKHFSSDSDDDDDDDNLTASSTRCSMSVAGSSFLIILAVNIIAIAVCLYCDQRLPVPKPATIPRHQFSEARAWPHLEGVAACGVRTTGSYANEICAPRHFIGAIRELEQRAQLDMHKTGVMFETDIARISGAFNLHFLDPFTNAYQNVTNIVMRISFNRKQKQQQQATSNQNRNDAEKEKGDDRNWPAVMVSAHYDSALGTVAAADNLANAAMLIEVASNIIERSDPLVYDVILVLGGAEEAIQQSAHAFVTGHRWSHNVHVFVNLEGAGGTGREIVFQTGPANAWLSEAYARVARYPYASILGQEIFASGLVPSDTDFWVYSGFLGVPGIDVSWIANGYLYHTPADDMDHGSVKPGSLQRAGENLLAVVCELANSPMLPATLDSQVAADMAARAEGMVFYDVLGLLMVVYSNSAAAIINGCVAALIVCYLLIESRTGRFNFIMDGVMTVCSIVVGTLVAALIGFALSFVNPLAWFGNQYLIVGLFVIPSCVAMCETRVWFYRLRGKPPVLYDSRMLAKVAGLKHEAAWQDERVGFNGALFVWTILLLCGTVFGLGSTFMALYWCVPSLLARIIFQRLRMRDSVRTLVFSLSYLPGLVITFSSLYTLCSFLIPLFGRSGTWLNADVVVGTLCGLFGTLICLMQSSSVHIVVSGTFVCCINLVHQGRKRNKGYSSNQKKRVHQMIDEDITRLRWIRSALVVSLVVLCTLAASVPPYSTSAPKRLFVQHVDRKFYDVHDYGLYTPAIIPSSREVRDSDGGFAFPLSGNTVQKTDAGIWLNTYDRRKMRDIPLSAEQRSRTEFMPCKGLYCSMPWILPVADVVQDGHYLRTEALSEEEVLPPSVHLRVQSLDPVSRRRRMYFSVFGPSHMTLVVSGHSYTCPVTACDDDMFEHAVCACEDDGDAHHNLADGEESCSSRLRAWSFATAVSDATYEARVKERNEFFRKCGDLKRRGRGWSSTEGTQSQNNAKDGGAARGSVKDAELDAYCMQGDNLIEHRLTRKFHSENGTALFQLGKAKKNMYFVYFASGQPIDSFPDDGILNEPMRLHVERMRSQSEDLGWAHDAGVSFVQYRARRRWDFWLEVNDCGGGSASETLSRPAGLRFALSTHHLDVHTAATKEFTKNMPEWVAAIDWSSYFVEHTV